MKEKWVFTKMVLTVGFGLLFIVSMGKFCELKTLSLEKESIVSVIEAKEIKTPFACEIKRMKLTGYCPCKKCCGDYADGKTSIGRNAWKTYGVAADPELLPYGTKLDIPGIGIRIVDDTGGAMRQSAKKGIYHIDVRFHSHEKAKEFGVKWKDIRILKAKTSLAAI